MTATGFGWAEFYLICFAIGFCFSVITFVFGSARFGRMHWPHFHGHAIPHVDVGHGTPGHATSGHGAAHAPAGHGSEGSGPGATRTGGLRGSVSPFNAPTIAAFLAWFGGTGYLLTRYSAMRVGAELTMSAAVGLVGGLGKLCIPIRQGGTGEMIYSQAGTRRVCGARSENGSSMEKGDEVVVTRYEKGLAYVRLWSEMSGE